MPRQKWRGISIFGMTNPFEPPKRLALGDAELAEALASAQGQEGSLGAMELLERQSELRAADSEAYVRWVREMESLATPEAKQALSAARRSAAGLPPEHEEEPQTNTQVTEDSWKSLVPDWEDRQQSIAAAKEKAIADALAQAEEREAEEVQLAVAAALAQAELEAEAKRAEAVAKVVEEAEALAAEKLAEEIRIAREAAEAAALVAEAERAERERAEAERAEAERLENERVEAERAEVERLEAERAEAERLENELAEAERAEAERVEEERAEAERKQIAEEEAIRAEQVIREELERAELAELEALIAAEEAAKAAAEEARAEVAVSEEAGTEEPDEDPAPVRAADFATGSFDIVESAEQAASEDFNEDNFDVLLADGELGFAREPISSAKDSPISTIDRRAKPYSQLFVWSSLSVGLLPLLFGFLTSTLELTFLDKLLSLFVGLSVSALIIAVAAVGGKRSGLPTLFLSRAAFGVRANYVPAIALVLVKIGFGTALVLAGLSLFDRNVLGVPSFAEPALADASISWLLVGVAALIAVSALLAFFGGKVLYFAQLGIASVAAIAAILFVATTASQVSLSAEDLTFSSNWVAVVSLAVLVAVFFGGFWVTSVAEFTRKVSMAQSGKMLGLFIALSAGVIPLLVAGYSLLVSSSLSLQASAIAIENPLGAMLTLVPDWMASVLLVSGALSLIIWSAAWMYSTSVSLSAISIRIRPAVSQPVLFVLVLAGAFAVSTLSSATFAEILDATIALSGVIVFAWAGVFVADISLRKIAYHEVSLTRDYGFYKAANFTNLSAFVLAVAVGLGFVSSTILGLDWLGYLARLAGAEAWADANIGFAIALGLSVLFPILFGRKRIRGQESEVLAIEARKNDLENVELDEA
jgi:purine-cytosine permease-like protein